MGPSWLLPLLLDHQLHTMPHPQPMPTNTVLLMTTARLTSDKTKNVTVIPHLANTELLFLMAVPKLLPIPLLMLTLVTLPTLHMKDKPTMTLLQLTNQPTQLQLTNQLLLISQLLFISPLLTMLRHIHAETYEGSNELL